MIFVLDGFEPVVHVVVFDRRESAKVHDMDTVMSHLAFPKVTVGYCAARYVGAEAIMATIPKMTRHCA
jgi:hypothetical protein